MQAPLSTTIGGPTFIRLLARLTDADVPQSKPLSDRLSQWLDWTHAIALSTALDGKAPAVASDGPSFGSAEEDECARVRASLTAAIAGDQAFAETGAVDAEVDYATFRQRYLALQRAMQAATGKLRGHLRDMLAQTSTDMARLAEVDAVLELALSPREHKLMAAVPTMLGEHFERLHQAEQKNLAHAQASGDIPAAVPGAWLEVFRKDMQSVLLAELDVRLQPVEGLLAALRTS